MGKWKKYYRIVFELVSGLNVGGDSINTDKDVLRNGAGEPFIPGSSLAGIYRACFKHGEQEKGFGYVKIHGVEDKIEGNGLLTERKEKETDECVSEELEQFESRVKVYDATLVEKYTVSERDGVGLDEFKTAKDGAKYDYEIVESGAKFKTFVEQNGESEDDFAYIDAIAKLWKDGRIRIGGKTRRGFGAVKAVTIKYAKFNLECETDRKNWLEFDMYSEDKYEEIEEKNEIPCEILKKDDRLTMELKLKLRGAISIRRYTTKGHTGDNKNAPMPDYEMLCNSDGKPVIPGTSWAGLFYHSFMTQGVTDEELKEIFGSTEKRSNISFSESIIEGGEDKVVSHTAIDRFTGGAAAGALYTERTHYGGTTTLTIGYAPGENIIKYLASAIADLNAGFIALGGLTSVGRGLFSVEGIKIGVEIKIDWDETKTYQDEIERSKAIYDAIINKLKPFDNGHEAEEGE